MQRATITACGLIFLLLAVNAGVLEAEDGQVDFDRDIQGILSDNCFKCHGPEEKERKAELRLDLPEGLIAKHGDRQAVVPGKPGNSELFRRITSDDEFERMPPPDSGKTLTAAEIALIKRWIEQGAQWEGHWAYVPLKKPVAPKAAMTGFVRNDIDRFVLARLQQQKWQPSAEADRVTLIRRLSFDLIGLPPTPAEVKHFLADKNPNAYEELVDRILKSPHFGERMALSWLDQVRYADTAGYHSDNHRDVWLYRDYVIKAFNENMPFDRFTIEQLAGDLLPNPTRWQRTASGYNRLIKTTEEGGAQAKEYQAKYDADRARNISEVWMAATMGCSQCHNHKFDPYTMKDFYSLISVFSDIEERPVGRQAQTPVPIEEQQAALRKLDAQMAGLRKTLGTQTPALDAALAKWDELFDPQALGWKVLRPVETTSAGEATFKTLDDGSVLVGGKNPPKDTYALQMKTDLKGITAIRLEVLPDDSLPAKGPGRAGNGNFVLSEFELQASGPQIPPAARQVKLSKATATHSQGGYNVAATIDGKRNTGWAILPQLGKSSTAVFETAENVGKGDELTLLVTMRFEHGGAHSIGHFRLSATASPRPVNAKGQSGPPKNIVDILALPREKRDAAKRQSLSAYFRTIAPALDAVRKRAASLEQQQQQLQKTFPTTLVSTAVKRRTIRILARGNWQDDSGLVMNPAAPEFLPAMKIKNGNGTRLDFARWLTSRENPLTSRVFVNRLWKVAFGEGLVGTLDDFGVQGDVPTHPRLLDWLAAEFIDSGWDVKQMLKRMVMSGTYRQSSAADAKTRQRDPDNKWLARQNRYRLDAEIIRDNSLAVSGLLSPKIGGPSVKPYQPAGYWIHLNFPKRKWVADKGENQYRRGLYTYWQRTFLHPSLLAFDAPSREECTANRSRSNNPLQALVLLNDPTYVEAARVFAERIIRDAGESDSAGLQLAFRICLSRDARPAEAKLLLALVQKHRTQYAADAKAADELLKVGQHAVPAGIDKAELAAWTSVTRVLLNLHETITRR